MGIGVWIILAAIILLLVLAVGIYNRLVRLRALAKEAFSGITVQLRRRADLIPNLVESVQGYATHEREVFDEVTARRAEATSAGSVEATAAADAHMTGLLSRLFAVAEAYPELKANTNFLQLQDQLVVLEFRHVQYVISKCCQLLGRRLHFLQEIRLPSACLQIWNFLKFPVPPIRLPAYRERIR